jgi:hypothetical protein
MRGSWAKEEGPMAARFCRGDGIRCGVLDLHANGVCEAVVDWSVYHDLASLEHLLLQVDRLGFLLVISLRRARFLALAAHKHWTHARANVKTSRYPGSYILCK